MFCLRARGFLLVLASLILASTNIASAQIVALGHSAVRGHVAENEMWPAVLEAKLRARGSQVHVTNAGVNGETTGATLARVSSAVPNGTKIVILAGGGLSDEELAVCFDRNFPILFKPFLAHDVLNLIRGPYRRSFAAGAALNTSAGVTGSI